MKSKMKFSDIFFLLPSVHTHSFEVKKFTQSFFASPINNRNNIEKLPTSQNSYYLHNICHIYSPRSLLRGSSQNQKFTLATMNVTWKNLCGIFF